MQEWGRSFKSSWASHEIHSPVFIVYVDSALKYNAGWKNMFFRLPHILPSLDPISVAPFCLYCVKGLLAGHVKDSAGDSREMLRGRGDNSIV